MRRAHLGPLPDHVVSRDASGTGGRRQERGQHVDGRRLARAVRPEEAVDLARVDHQADPVDRAIAAELLDESIRLDRVRRRLASVSVGGAAGGAITIGPARRTSITVDPIPTRSPVLSATVPTICSPFTNVPLMDPRSRTVSPAPAGRRLHGDARSRRRPRGPRRRRRGRGRRRSARRRALRCRLADPRRWRSSAPWGSLGGPPPLRGPLGRPPPARAVEPPPQGTLARS